MNKHSLRPSQKQSLASYAGKLSVVLATRNEERNIGRCLESVKGLADEIVIMDERSSDRTVEIAKGYGAKIYDTEHEPIFHITKQKAIDKATGDWVLQLDADEIVSPDLAREIKEVINLRTEEIKERRNKDNKKQELLQKHQRIIEQRDGPIGRKTGEIVAFFIPRVNYFLGEPLIHAGVYPDPSIRLVSRGKAHFTGRSVHDIMQVDGEVSWLFNDLVHNDSPTLSRYLKRMNRYTDLKAQELQNSKTPKNLLYLLIYSSLKPLLVFLNLYVRHKGFLDGLHGFLWSLFSALHYPIAYFKYWTGYKQSL